MRTTREQNSDEARPPKFYEMDGALKASNAWLRWGSLCMLLVATTALGAAIYTSTRPPTVIRVGPSGEATALPTSEARSPVDVVRAATPAQGAPSELEARAFVRTFLTRYANLTPADCDRNLAEALNMMTKNLRSFTRGQLADRDTVGKIKEENLQCRFRLRSYEPLKEDPMSWVAYGAKEVHRVRNGNETTDRLVVRYDLRLVQEERSERNPSGLRVAEYSEAQVMGDRDNELQQRTALRD